MIVPVRAGPLLAAALKPTGPLPVPDPDVTVNQSGLFDAAVQAHEGLLAVTVTVPLPPPPSTACPGGEIVKLQDGAGAAACEMLNVCPATVIVPERAAPVFAAAVKLTVPFPMPDAPPVIVIQLALVEAFHEHELPLATENDPLPPPLSTDWLEGESEKLQAAAA